MIPILYEATERNFTTNGLGRLSDAVECTVTEERNGSYELYMRYPTTGAHYADIVQEQIIYAPHDDTKVFQPFRIYRISKPLNGIVSVYAEHISYLLTKTVVNPFTASSCAEALSGLRENAIGGTEFTFWTDKEVSAKFVVTEPHDIRGLLAGQEGSILDVYGTGEYEWDHFNVKLHLHRGADNGVTLRHGKNITDITADTDMTNTYTAIVPYWKNEEKLVMLPEKILYAGTQYAGTLAKAIDLSDQWENAPTAAQLRIRANKYLANNKGWEITQNTKVDFVQLWQTKEYENYAPLQRVRLCDTVKVVYDPLHVETTAKVVKTVYNVLLDRYDEVEVGDASATLTDAVKDIEDDTSLDEIKSLIRSTEKHYYDYISLKNIAVASGGDKVKVAEIVYQAGSQARAEFQAEIKFLTATTDDGAEVKVTYENDGTEIVSYYPQEVLIDGNKLLHLLYIWTTQVKWADTHLFRVYLESTDADLTVTGVHAYVMTTGNILEGENPLLYIEVAQEPYKLDYVTGETADYSGVVILAIYEDGTEVDVTNVCTYSPADGSTLSTVGYSEVTVTYTDQTYGAFTTEFTINVERGAELVSIEVTTPPNQTEWTQGDTLDLAGIVVTGTYDDGTTEDVTAQCTFSPASGDTLTVAGIITDTVTLGELTTSFELDVADYPFFDLRYVVYTIDNTNKLIRITALNVANIVADNLASLTIPDHYEYNGVTYQIYIA